jgi:uncharacterized cupredoxin-like copper-binding protein
MTPPAEFLRAFLILGLLIGLSSCGERHDPGETGPSDMDVEDNTPDDIAFNAQSEVMYRGDSIPAQVQAGLSGERVDVNLMEFQIDMPDTVTAGLIDFAIHNLGETEHSFAMEGPNLEAKLEAPMPPTASVLWLRAFLVPGTYQLACPVEDHAERGMTRRLVVQPEAEGEDP